jgi:hypothetical protein
MANPSIRGHQGTLKIFRDGGEIDIFTIRSADITEDSDFTRSFFVGQRRGEGDQTINGYSGSVEMEVKGPEIDEFMDALQADNLNGIGVKDYSLVLSEFYGDGRAKSYVYFDCQFRMDKRISGLNEKVIKTYAFQASGRQAVN